MATEKFIPGSLFAVIDHILDQAEQWANQGEKDLDNKYLNRAWGAVTSIADIKMDSAHWRRLNNLRDHIIKSWKQLGNRPRRGLGAFDDDPDMWYGDGDPNDYGDQ